MESPHDAHRKRPTAAGFRVRFDDDRLWWSDDLFRIHGFEPGDIVPTVTLMMSHCHREDRDQLETLLRGYANDTASVRYRLMDTAGGEHLTLATVLSPPEPGAATDGVLVDLTAETESLASANAGDGLAALHKSHEAVDQAVGALMLAYALDAPGARDVLSWHGRNFNTEVRTVAELVTAGLAGSYPARAPAELVDGLLADRELLAGTLKPTATAGSTTDPTQRLSLQRDREGRCITVHVLGEIDAATVPLLVAGVRQAARAVPPNGTLVLDLSGLRRFSQVADLHVARLLRRCDRLHVNVQVVPPDPWPRLSRPGS